MKFGVQLYNFRNALAEDFRGAMKEIAKIGFDGVEFAGNIPMEAGELAAFLKELRTECCGTMLSGEKLNLFNTYWILIIVGTVKYIPFASRSALNSMLQLSGEIEEAAIIQDIPWVKRMTRIIIPIQKSSIISGYLLPFMTCLRELSLFMLLCVQGFILSTTLDYFDEMGLYAFSSGINLILIVTILVFNAIVNKVTGASLDEGIGG